MIKKSIVFLVLVVLVFSFSSLVSAGDKSELVIWNTAEMLANPLTEDYIAQFEKENPNVDVKFFTFPWQELRTKLLTAFAAGTAPDILQLDTPWLPEFTSANLLEPAPDYVKKDLDENFLPIAKYIVSFDGQVYGYPWWAFTNALIYNKDLFKDSGLDPDNPPKTWEELRQAAEKIVKFKDGEMTQAGFLINQRLLHLTDFLYNNGGVIIGENAKGIPQKPVKATFNSKPVVEALTFLHDLYYKYNVGSPHFTTNMYESFQAGEVGMLIEAQWLIPWTLSAAPDLNFGIAPIPTPTGKFPQIRVDSWIMVVSKKSKSEVKEYAWKFLSEYISTSQGDMLKAALAAPTRKELDLTKIEELTWYEQFYSKYIKEGFPTTKPFHVNWEEMSRRVEPILEQMYLGILSPEDTAQMANEELEAILAGN